MTSNLNIDSQLPQKQGVRPRPVLPDGPDALEKPFSGWLGVGRRGCWSGRLRRLREPRAQLVGDRLQTGRVGDGGLDVLAGERECTTADHENELSPFPLLPNRGEPVSVS